MNNGLKVLLGLILTICMIALLAVLFMLGKVKKDLDEIKHDYKKYDLGETVKRKKIEEIKGVILEKTLGNIKEVTVINNMGGSRDNNIVINYTNDDELLKNEKLIREAKGMSLNSKNFTLIVCGKSVDAIRRK